MFVGSEKLKKKKNLKNNLKKTRDNKAISFFGRFSETNEFRDQ